MFQARNVHKPLGSMGWESGQEGYGGTVGGLESATMHGCWPDNRAQGALASFNLLASGVMQSCLLFKYWSKCLWID